MASYPRMASNYSAEEVRALVEGWEELTALKGVEPSSLNLLCRLIDMASAIARLGPKEYQAVLLCGQLGIAFRTAGVMLGCAADTMFVRYQRALEVLTTDLNTGGS